MITQGAEIPHPATFTQSLDQDRQALKLASTEDMASYCKALVTLDIASGGGWEPKEGRYSLVTLLFTEGSGGGKDSNFHKCDRSVRSNVHKTHHIDWEKQVFLFFDNVKIANLQSIWERKHKDNLRCNSHQSCSPNTLLLGTYQLPLS